MCESVMFWVGQNRWYAPYMTVYLVIPVPKITVCTPYICRVGQNHIYTVCIRYLWQGNHQIYGHIRRIYTVLANPIYLASSLPTIPNNDRICIVLANPYNVKGVKINHWKRTLCTYAQVQAQHGHTRCIYTVLANPIYIRSHHDSCPGRALEWPWHCNTFTFAHAVAPVAPKNEQEYQTALVTFLRSQVVFRTHMGLHFDVFLPTSSRVCKVSNFQLLHSPFFTWFVLRFTSFS